MEKGPAAFQRRAFFIWRSAVRRLRMWADHQMLAPVCDQCTSTMRVRRVVPKTWTLPELRTYLCGECGNLRTIEIEEKTSASGVRMAANKNATKGRSQMPQGRR